MNPEGLGRKGDSEAVGDHLSDLALHLADLNEDLVLATVRRRIAAGEDPLGIIEECVQGIWEVGERYARREYFVSGLIMGGEIFREVVQIIEPLIQEGASRRSVGTVLLGTVQGDIHDMGKNLLAILLRCHGFSVRDLGVDVAPADFVEAMAEERPDVIGLSGILTMAFDSMRETIAVLRSGFPEGEPPPPIIIGGGMIDEHVRVYVGADYWSTDAIAGVRLCQELVASRAWHPSTN